MHKLITSFDSKIHFLQITSGNMDAEKIGVKANMKTFATTNNITNYDGHIIRDTDVENGVIHFN